MTDFERIAFRTRDGVTLRADFYRADGEGVGIVAMASGFGLVKELFGDFARALRSAGISALAYDYRGFGSSDGMPRYEVDLNQQASDFHDVITAASALPGVDAGRVCMLGVGHGGSVAMMAASNDPRLRAVVLHAPFPSGQYDALIFPVGALDQAWRERQEMARGHVPSPTYAKSIRDWEMDGQGDNRSVFVRGVEGYRLYATAKDLSEAAGTPWENKVTLQSFLNVAGTEAQDFAERIRHRTLYIVHRDDPFTVPPETHERIFRRMGPQAEFRIVERNGMDFGSLLGEAGRIQIDYLRRVL